MRRLPSIVGVSLFQNDMKIIEDIRKELKQKSDPRAKSGESRFFKEKIKHYGIKNDDIKKISKKYFEIVKPLGKREIFKLCEELFKSGYMEEAFIASNWSFQIRKDFVQSDFIIFEKWVKNYIDNWAKCDDFCNHTVGSFIDKYPKFVGKLKMWTKSKNKWVKRASAVSLIAPARKGLFLKDVFEIADLLLLDEDDMVQKGYGWLLKVTADKNRLAVFNYVMRNKDVMPRTSLRYAIEKMPQDLKKRAMQK